MRGNLHVRFLGGRGRREAPFLPDFIQGFDSPHPLQARQRNEPHGPSLPRQSDPDAGLTDAREKRDAARRLLASNIEPSAPRKAVKAGR